MHNNRLGKLVGIVAAGAAGAMCFAVSADGANPNLERLQRDWRAAIAHTPTPANGCFAASYPLTIWRQVDCATAPQRPYIPAGMGRSTGTVGNGNDYAAVTSPPTASAVGSFPVVKGLKTETDNGRSNVYSLQLNSNFMSNDKACAHATNPAQCQGWEQFVYSSSSRAAFMQYWLIHYGTCPAGWAHFSDSCYKNSKAVGTPFEPIGELKNLSLSGTATNSTDTLVLTTRTKAYSTTGQDNVVFLVNGWHASEFNIVGDGGGSAATFNAGTSLTVEIDLKDGSTSAPVCQAHGGTTGETNNLILGSCKASGGSTPSVSFTESLHK